LDAVAIRRIRQKLIDWGREHYQPYPWRGAVEPWHALVAELLLQRTRAAQAAHAFSSFQTMFPTPAHLLAAGPGAVQALTSKVGIHWRAETIYEIARMAEAYDGIPPADMATLLGVRGIGPYTAAAWLSLHCRQRFAIVDSNVSRWLCRLTGRPYERDPRHARWLLRLAGQLTPKRAFKAYNYAVLDFTMTVCVNPVPRCEVCPLRRDCCYRAMSNSKSPTPRA
jgi:A/G-specific adenine glycosylase